MARFEPHPGRRPVIVAGASSGIGAATATEIVAWYNGHPEFANLSVDLSGERVVVVGNGNVALDVARVRALLAFLSERAAGRASLTAPIRERIEAVNAALFEDFGLEGNAGDYYDPKNSFLHCALQQRQGIPISLCIVWGGLASFMRSTGIDQMQAEFVAERPATAIYARVLRNLVSLSASAAEAERGVRPAANGRLRTNPRGDRAGGGL